MRNVTILALIGLALSAVPVAAFDRIELYSDPAMSNCNLDDNGVGPKSVYMAHNAPAGATASQFQVPTPACWIGATFVASTPAPGFSAVGDASSDILISYGACWGGSFLIGTISYFSMGLATACCSIRITKAPTAPLDGIVTVDCASTPHVISAPFQILINPDQTCLCSNPVQDATWGGIKALYR